jgi:hypothetical protein
VRLTAEERLHLPRTPAPSVVLCRPDAWGRVSFAATPVSIVGWLYDPDHSFVVSTYGFLIERNRAFASVRHHTEQIAQVPGRSRQPIQALQDQHVDRIQPSRQLHEVGVGHAPLVSGSFHEMAYETRRPNGPQLVAHML